jgi:hypothetical protein
MVQPNKVDFGVRKLLKRKEVSRDCMTLSEHGECCIRRCRSSSDVCSMRLFAAKITPLLGTPRIAPPTTSRTQASNCQAHLGLLAASQRPHNRHLRLIQHTKPHASCCITSSRLAHRRNRKTKTDEHVPYLKRREAREAAPLPGHRISHASIAC